LFIFNGLARDQFHRDGGPTTRDVPPFRLTFDRAMA
jgi:hypothetical protein